MLPRALLADKPPEDWRRVLSALGCAALHLEHTRVTPELADAVHAAGYGLLCYTVNDSARAAAVYSLGVDCIVTDRLDLFQP
jgi:glycerophosphoryl diester phosphodiesterase